ncbi:hypothetical protein CEXT_203001, partial [Caerostris extrusa]
VFRSRTKNSTADGRPLQNIEHAACLHSPEEEDDEDLHLDVLLIRDFGNCILRSDVFQIWDYNLRT